MFRTKRVNQALDRARKARAQLKPAADRMKPVATKTGAAARRQVHKTRVWAAPRVRRTGKILQENVAPKVSAMMSSAAERIDPGKSRSTRWRKRASGAALAAAAGAAAAAVRKRMSAAASASDGASDASSASASNPSGPSDGQASPSGGAAADADSQLRAS